MGKACSRRKFRVCLTVVNLVADMGQIRFMVNMSVSKKHGVKAIHFERQDLLAEIRRSINNNLKSGRLDIEAGPPPLIERIGGNTHRAAAPNGGNTD